MPNSGLHFPSYNNFNTAIANLALPLSGSEIHGIMCGYLCAGAGQEGLSYLHALLVGNRDTERSEIAKATLFDVFSLSEQQINSFDFEFKLMLPDDSAPLITRAEAFSLWCRGFVQGLKMSGIKFSQFEDEDAEDAIKHLQEFAALDYEELQVSEEDEKAFMEVSEYTRMAVLKIYADLFDGKLSHSNQTAH